MKNPLKTEARLSEFLIKIFKNPETSQIGKQVPKWCPGC